MADDGVVVAGGRLTDWASLGVMAAFVPRDAVDDAGRGDREAGEAVGRQAPDARDGLFVIAVALVADDDEEEVASPLMSR